MSGPTLLEAFGMSVEEILKLNERFTKTASSNKGLLARKITTNKLAKTDRAIASMMWECKNVLSKAGLYSEIYITKEDPVPELTWELILERVFKDPLSMRNRTAWLMFQACLEAQADFALDVCPAPSHESILTGRFIERLSAACKGWAECAEPFLNRIDGTLRVDSIDLSIKGGEQENGGDFALILDIKSHSICPEDNDEGVNQLCGRPRGDIIIPILFQAKRYNGKEADISQKHKVRGYQFNKLHNANCASSYIFYENGDNRIDYPAIPMVKPSECCDPVETSPRTEVFLKSSDFATYIMRALNGFPDIPPAATREDALRMVFSAADKGQLSRIVILGNTSGLDLEYASALNNLSGGQDINEDQNLPENDEFHP